MNNILVLPGQVANKIAAGEVAERPALVIKELVENSIDAGATKIRIQLQTSGMKQIRVSDDGGGIPKEEIPLAFARHGTSKLRDITDLATLATMGFRGEALASIAAVAKVRLTTKTAADAMGYSSEVIDGVVSPPVKAPSNDGTEIIVDDLFYNTPARKRFMATPTAEMREIADLIGKLIIAQHHISFELTNDGKRYYLSPGKGGQKAAIMSVYGKELVDQLLPVFGEVVEGYVSHPSFHRPNRSYYHFYINGRYIKNDLLNKSLEEAYHTLIPDRRFPVAFLNIVVEPSEYDVNVHPNKLEVKFKSGNTIQQAVTEAGKEAIASATRAYEYPAERGRVLKSPPPETLYAKPTLEHEGSEHPPTEKPPVFEVRDYRYDTEPQEPKADHGPTDLKDEASIPTLTDVDMPIFPPTQWEQEEAPSIDFDQRFYSSLTVLGQWAGSFIVANDDEALYLIDQHAAHERLLYNSIRKAVTADTVTRQPLLVPLEWKLNRSQYEWVLGHILILHDLGFILEDFGDHLFLLREEPIWAVDIDVIAFLTDFADGWIESGKTITKERILDHKLMTRACKSAVKANQHLTSSDIRYLFDALDAAEDGFTCPHGRPIAIKYTMAEVRRQFLRT